MRYFETDQMGVVHHANYIVWCELARTRLCLEAGFHYAEIEKRGLLLLVTGVHLTYRAPARYGDTVRAACWVDRVGSRGVTFEYRIDRSDAADTADTADPAHPAGSTLLATASTEHVWVDAGTRRPVRFPEELKAPFERFLPSDSSSRAVD